MSDNYQVQQERARQMTDEELKKHAAVGRVCDCHDCFCCTALEETFARINIRASQLVETNAQAFPGSRESGGMVSLSAGDGDSGGR